MPNSPNRKRGRIGLTLAPDVHDILNEYGRCVYVPASAVDGPLRCRNCGKELMDKAHDMRRPTRTEILEAGARLWAREQANGRPLLDSQLDRSTERIDDVSKLAPAGYLADHPLRDEYLEELKKPLPLERKQVVSIPKPGKKK